MKEIEWVNPNHMKFDSLHKTFNRQVDIISAGNVIGAVQYSSYIRPYTLTLNPVGEEKPLGYLQEWDLKWFRDLLPQEVLDTVHELTKERYGILYIFKHYSNGRRILHGAVLTDYDHRLLRKFYLRWTEKSISVIDEATKYIAEGLE